MNTSRSRGDSAAWAASRSCFETCLSGARLERRRQRGNSAIGLAQLNRPDLQLLRVSSLYETEPIGLREQRWFLNLVAEFETDLFPKQLLHACRRVESELGRRRTVRNGPRTIDIDILLYGNVVVDDHRRTGNSAPSLPRTPVHARAAGGVESRIDATRSRERRWPRCSPLCLDRWPASEAVTQHRVGRKWLAARWLTRYSATSPSRATASLLASRTCCWPLCSAP